MNSITNIKILNWLYDNKDFLVIQYGNKNSKGVACKGYFIKNNKMTESKIYNDPFKIIIEFFNCSKKSCKNIIF